MLEDPDVEDSESLQVRLNQPRGQCLCQTFKVARNMTESEEGVVRGGKTGGEEEEEKRGDKRERKEKPALIQSMGSIFAECVEGTGGIRRRAGGAGS